MINFTPLASSSQGNCYLLSSPGVDPILIDAGVRFAEIQKALDFKVGSLAGCLVSHAHGDHSVAVKDLLRHYVDCYASAYTWEHLGLQLGPRRFVEHLEPVQVGVWQVTPFDAVHDMPGTLGFVIDGMTARCLYLTDSAYCKYRFEDLTHIFIECNHSAEIMRENARSGDIGNDRYKRTATNHMSIERLVAMLKANDLSKVVEIHLLHLSDANSDEVAFKETVMRATGKPVHVAPAHQTRQLT